MMVVTRLRHGHSRRSGDSPEYSSWRAMIRRCQDENNPDYPRWGGRGVTVCERWQTFDNFLADMGERPAGTTLDRVKSDKGYEPSNCRWATPREQTRNRPTFNKLSPMAARVIRRLREGRMAGKDVAVVFGVNAGTIYKIGAGKIWSDI